MHFFKSTVFYRLEAAWLVFRIKAARFIFAFFNFVCVDKKLGKQSTQTVFGEKSSKNNHHEEALIISIVLLS